MRSLFPKNKNIKYSLCFMMLSLNMHWLKSVIAKRFIKTLKARIFFKNDS